MKQKRFIITLCIVCLFFAGKIFAVTASLDLSMTGSFDDNTNTITAQVNRTHSGFGLGVLNYTLGLSETLRLSREYSDHGWIANDGDRDTSNPIDMGPTGSAPATFNSITLATSKNPAGTDFFDAFEIVELITIQLTDLTPRWIYFDITSASALTAEGEDMVTEFGGTLNIIPDQTGHTLGIYVTPEPSTMAMLAIGSLALIKRRKK
jgi:hypothetical protein